MSDYELIHPLDLSDLLNDYIDVLNCVEVFKEVGPNGEDLIVFPKSGRKFIQSPDAPRKTWVIE
jgi:hypothetical protein